MKKRILSFLLVLVMTAAMLPSIIVGAADNYYTPKDIKSDYFYNQLNDRAKAIYDKLFDEFTGDNKAQYYEGTQPIDLIDVTYGSGSVNHGQPIITETDITNYRNGNKDIFNDFCAAKDALDLDHSELWYIDSGYLTFRVTHGSVETEYGDGYHVLIGPGRGETYLLGGLTASEIAGSKGTIQSMDEAINSTINKMVQTAVTALNTANSNGTYSEPDKLAFLATNIHDQITKGIHYRYEIECTYPEDAKFIRTIYGMQTHEGVCEAYARTLQVCLTKLGIESVLIHGVQTKGTPEDHMWNAVNIPNTDDNKTPRWYVIDATWDDPLTATYTGERDLSFHYGEDGKETNTYLLVGQSLVGEHWRPSGYVSTGNFEFKYPTIETAAYSGATILGDDNGLKVDYSTGSSEEGVPAGVFSVTYQGMDAAAARKKGLYFMVKMYDYHPDGTADVMKEWYYADATFALSKGNPYFGDYDGALRIYTPTCEYVEIAVTTREPDQRDTWENDPATNYLSISDGEAGYFHGDESEIIAQSGMLYNVNSKYEAPPYVLTQFPAPNGNCTAGYDYRFDVVFDDDLKHPQADDPATADAFTDDTQLAAGQKVRVRYTTIQQDLHTGGEKYVQIAGELPFDQNRDGYVDMPGDNGVTTDKAALKWKYKYDGKWSECPNHEKHENNQCDVNKGCAIVGVEFNFRASDQWIDDITEYNFSIEGVVGSRSNKFPNNFSVISCIPGLCPACYRSQGIDWNLWGQPTLLDAPENLDLYNMAKEGGTDATTLEKLNEEMHRDDINGRLMLVVEDKSKGAGNREDYERINDALPQDEKNAIAGADEVISSVFEINFNRICPMVKLKPNQGQSLRVQVGYPAGITYEQLTSGSSNIELKAYHFTRCANTGKVEDQCDEYKKAIDGKSSKEQAEIALSHKWGEHIIGVDEITIIPTPYGMVIMCDAFSPFEIVAVKKSDTAAIAAAAETGSTLVVVSDGNGTVSLVGGEEAVGKNGNVTFENDSVTKTFKVNPNEGYEVDTVILGGSQEPITVSPDGTFEVTGITSNNVLNVTFVPQTVTAAEQEFGYGDAVEVKACPHTTLQEDTNDPKPNATADCTHPGYKRAQVCTTCGQTVVPATVIPATGHTFNESQPVPRDSVTCTNGVTIPAVNCTTCHNQIYAETTIPALGHDFENYTNIGDATCKGQQMEGKCTRCNVTSTITNKDAAVGHSFTQFVKTVTEATCTENATAEYECKWCGQKAVQEVPNSQKSHVNNGSGVCTLCGINLCKDGHTWVEHAKVDPTCETPGQTAYKECSVCKKIEGTIEIIPALGHDFGESHTAGTQCRRCSVTLQSDQHTERPIPEVQPTCDTPGSKGGIECSECHQIIKQSTIIPALGHKWDETGAEITWPTTGHAAYVLLTCERNSSHHLTINATVTEGAIIKDSTCTEHGKRKYSAVAELPSGKLVESTADIADLPLAAHKPVEGSVKVNEATCTRDGTKEYTCSVCREHIVEVTEKQLPHNVIELTQGSKPATCTESGLLKGTCSLCHEQVSQVVPATGHNYVNNVCTRCGAVKSSSTPSTPSGGSSGGSSKTDTVTGTDGSKTTTVTESDGSTTKTTTTVEGIVGITKTDADGNTTSVEVIMPSAPESGDTVVAPVEVRAAASAEDAPEISITVREGSARVEIPVVDVRPGTVAVIVDEKGNETVVRDCVTDDNGVIITVDGSVTVKIVDRSVEFKDVQDANHWASDAVEFVAARGLFNGTGNGVFSPETAMTRGMLVTVLYRLAYEPEAADAGMTFGDVSGSDYYSDAVAWADDNDVVNGYTDGSFRPGNDVSREQLVTILYRYAKLKGYSTEVNGNALAPFTDVQNIQSYAVDAMNWAVSNGLVNGVSADKLSPQSGAKRAQVAAILERFCENVVK